LREGVTGPASGGAGPVSGYPAGQEHQTPGYWFKDGLGQDCAQQVGDSEVQDDLLQPGLRLIPPGHGVGDPGQDRVHHHHVDHYGGIAHDGGHHDGRAAKFGEEGAGVKARQDVCGPEAVAEKVPEKEGVSWCIPRDNNVAKPVLILRAPCAHICHQKPP